MPLGLGWSGSRYLRCSTRPCSRNFPSVLRANKADRLFASRGKRRERHLQIMMRRCRKLELVLWGSALGIQEHPCSPGTGWEETLRPDAAAGAQIPRQLNCGAAVR